MFSVDVANATEGSARVCSALEIIQADLANLLLEPKTFKLPYEESAALS